MSVTKSPTMMGSIRAASVAVLVFATLFLAVPAQALGIPYMSAPQPTYSVNPAVGFLVAAVLLVIVLLIVWGFSVCCCRKRNDDCYYGSGNGYGYRYGYQY